MLLLLLLLLLLVMLRHQHLGERQGRGNAQQGHLGHCREAVPLPAAEPPAARVERGSSSSSSSS
jgi:hypothetical protein